MKSNKNSSDNKKHWKNWEIILLTVGICAVVFGIVNSIAFFIFRQKKDGDNLLLHGDQKH